MLWNKEQEQERILKATLCYVYMMPLLRRYIKYVLLMESHSSYIPGPPIAQDSCSWCRRTHYCDANFVLSGLFSLLENLLYTLEKMVSLSGPSACSDHWPLLTCTCTCMYTADYVHTYICFSRFGYWFLKLPVTYTYSDYMPHFTGLSSALSNGQSL